MDQSLDGVDDLFGGPDDLDMTLGQSTAVDGMLQSSYTRQGLAQRLDELKMSGCSRKDDGRWKLSDEVPIPQVPQVHDGRPIVYLSYSDYAHDLVMVDSGGRISVFTTYSAVVNSLTNSMAVNRDADDDAAQPVGFAWCVPNRDTLIYDAARRAGSDNHGGALWEYTTSKHPPSGILQPGTRPAFFCVTKMGYLKVLYQQMDGHWTENISELIKVSYSNQLLTHASVASVKG
ncbi:mediator complex subunit [Ascosphaera aggregata]|nr:mediator complex subunit [Ascosphaera aggregata]